jgi:hypothetical protein
VRCKRTVEEEGGLGRQRVANYLERQWLEQTDHTWLSLASVDEGVRRIGGVCMSINALKL